MKTLLKLLGLPVVCFYCTFSLADRFADKFEFAQKHGVLCLSMFDLKSDEEGEQLSLMLEKLKGKIERFELFMCGVSKATISHIVRFIREDKNLETFSLSDINVDNEDVKELADALRGKSLKMLRLSKCNLDDADIKNIVEVLPSMTNLKLLTLSGNDRVTDEGGKALLAVLPQVKLLKQIGINNKGMSIELRTSIKEAVKELKAHCVPEGPILLEQFASKKRCVSEERTAQVVTNSAKTLSDLLSSVGINPEEESPMYKDIGKCLDEDEIQKQ